MAIVDTQIAQCSTPDNLPCVLLDDVFGGLRPERCSVLCFALAPVQEFIEASRSMRDLWASSLILSRLVEAVMTSVAAKHGVIVYPQTLPKTQTVPEEFGSDIASTPHRFVAIVPDGNEFDWKASCQKSLTDEWTQYSNGVLQHIKENAKQGDDMIWKSEYENRWIDQVTRYWEVRTSTVPLDAVKLEDDKIARLLGGLFFSDRFPELNLLRNAALRTHGLKESAKSIGRWQIATQLANMQLQCNRSARHMQRASTIAMPKMGDSTAAKCHMFGTFEVLGPARYSESMDFWSKLQECPGMYLKPGQRFCAIGMIKRLLPHVAGWKVPRFDDSARVAASRWLEQKVSMEHSGSPSPSPREGREERAGRAELPSVKEADNVPPSPAATASDPPRGRVDSSTLADLLDAKCPNWEPRWLHLHRLPSNEASDAGVIKRFKGFRSELVALGDRLNSSPPVYYAALIMDADHCHRRLSGKSLEPMRQLLTSEDIDAWSDQHQGSDWWLDNRDFVLGCRRPLTPQYHVEISTKQSRFGISVVPQIINGHFGQLVYCGGDEFLAFLPLSDVLPAAAEIRQQFSREDYFGKYASMSAGIAIAHYKEDLRGVLVNARAALSEAKSSGRNTCVISAQLRAGRSMNAICPWGFMNELQSIVSLFRPDGDQRPASDRWLNSILQQWETMSVFHSDDGEQLHPAIEQLLVKRVAHSQLETCQRIESLGKALPWLAWQLDPEASESDNAAFVMSQLAKKYLREAVPRIRSRSWRPDIDAMESFLSLCWIASFCSRGGD